MKIPLQIGKIDRQKGVRCVQGGIAIGKIGCALEKARGLAERPGVRAGLGNWLRDAVGEAKRMRKLFPKAAAQAKAIEEGLQRWEGSLTDSISDYEAPKVLQALDSLDRELRVLAKESLGRCGKRMPQAEDADRLVREGRGAAKKARAPAESQAPPSDLPREVTP